MTHNAVYYNVISFLHHELQQFKNDDLIVLNYWTKVLTYLCLAYYIYNIYAQGIHMHIHMHGLI